MNNYKEDNNLPTENELASELKTSVGKIREVMDVEKRRHVMSLDQILSYTDSDGQSLSDKIPCNNYNALTENQENRIMLKTALSSLDENLREVVTLHFFQDISQTKIAEMVGISQMQVSRRIKKALRCLFDIMNEEKEFKQND
jgi:RNA polymerase sigma factor (sigma-70 family)